jgi:hypothetical protein
MCVLIGQILSGIHVELSFSRYPSVAQWEESCTGVREANTGNELKFGLPCAMKEPRKQPIISGHILPGN